MSGSSWQKTAAAVHLFFHLYNRILTIALLTVTLGISKYAANALGDVIYVELPKEGLEIGNGDAIGAVESVKSASDILTPVAGKVIDANSILEEKPSLLNNDPEGEGWIAKLQVDGDAVATVEGLMDEEGYKAFTDESS